LFALPVLVGTFVATNALAAPTSGQGTPPPPSSAPKTTAQNKPPAKPQQPAPAKPPVAKNATTGPTSGGTTNKTARTTESAVRRQISGGPTYDDAAGGADTPELRALAAAERELFPPASPTVGTPWPQELPLPVAADHERPRVHASGLPPAHAPSTPPANEGAKDLSWLAKLDMPDLPVRWEPRVVRYLDFFKDDPRGRATITTWLKRSGRYRDGMRKVLRKKGLPEDLTALSMIESGFDPTARSPVGAMGLWQFMPDTGKIYGLTQDRWADQRMSIGVATEAAADHLADLHRRFGSWELAMAAYNMGYGGVLQAVRRYNTNDYWALSKLEGSLPWETSLYVPKIIAAAIVMKNLAAFNFADVAQEPALEGEDVPVAPGTALATVATACGTTTKEVELLNPELRASRTPPTKEDWPVKVPAGKASGCASNLARARKDQPSTERYVVRFGETIEQIAQNRKITVAKIVELNAIGPGEVVRGGTVLLVPQGEGTAPPVVDPKKAAEKPVVIVPTEMFVYPDRRRVFYRVQIGDTVKDVCAAFKVTPDEVRRWNDIDTSARLVESMTIQLFVPREADLSHAVALGQEDVRVIVTGTEEFFTHWDDKGRKRIVVTAKAGETIEQIGKRNGVSANMMARINRRSPSEVLTEGERVVVWLPGPSATPPANAPQQTATLARPLAPEPTATPPLALPPMPDALPPVDTGH